MVLQHLRIISKINSRFFQRLGQSIDYQSSKNQKYNLEKSFSINFQHFFCFLQLMHLSISFSSILFIMPEESEIIDLSGLPTWQILDSIEHLLEQSCFDTFKLVLKRTQKIQQPPSARVSKKRTQTKYSNFSNMRSMSERRSQSQLIDEFEGSKGVRLYQMGDYDRAVEALQQEEKELRESFKNQCKSLKQYQSAVFHLGSCYYRTKKYGKAVECFGQRFEGEELRQQGQKLNNLGSCYAHLGNSRLSLNSYAQALKIYSNFPQIDCSNLLNNLGMLYAQSQMYETAQKYFSQSIQQRKAKSPDDAFLLYASYLQLGKCQRKSQKYTEAIANFTFALNFAERGFGSLTQVLYHLAGIFEETEKWEQALNCYQKLSSQEKDKGLLYESVSRVYRFMGRQTDYERFLAKAYQCYEAENNQRKVSELLPLIARISMK